MNPFDWNFWLKCRDNPEIVTAFIGIFLLGYGINGYRSLYDWKTQQQKLIVEITQEMRKANSRIVFNSMDQIRMGQQYFNTGSNLDLTGLSDLEIAKKATEIALWTYHNKSPTLFPESKRKEYFEGILQSLKNGNEVLRMSDEIEKKATPDAEIDKMQFNEFIYRNSMYLGFPLLLLSLGIWFWRAKPKK